MESVLPVVLMLAAVLVSSVVAQIFPKAPASLVQIALGIALAMSPAPVTISLDPDFFLIFFIAPLLYWDAMEADKKALWRQRRPVLALALGLVLLIVLVVGFFTHALVPSIPLAAAFALGAALGPTDAVAVTTLGKRLSIDKNHKMLLQGECLLNDASGVVSFQFAIAALVTGTFSVVDAGLSLAWSFVGGIVLGALLAGAKGLIINYVRRNYGSLIGEATAERIKHEIGSAYPGDEVREIEVRGRNLAEGVPRGFTLNSNEILEALQEPLTGIVSAVMVALEQCPPELASDISERGMVLTGGGALLRNLDRLLMEETGIPVVVAEDPLTCVARGGGKALEMIDMHGGDLFSEE